MEKISKLMGLLVFGLAGVALAANPFTYECKTTEIPQEADESGFVGNAYYDFDCSISQSSVARENPQENEFSTWDDLLENFHSYVLEWSNDGFIRSINIKLGTDIRFDPLPSDGSACTNSTSGDYSLYFSGTGDAKNSFDGAGHSITNFCMIGQGDQNGYGFFKWYRNGSIKNVTFDSAYVMAKLDDGEYAKDAGAAVVVVSATNVAFEKVTVKNSNVYGMDVGAVASSVDGGSFSNVSVISTDVGTPNAVFPDYEVTGEPEAISASSVMGGVAASVSGVKSFENITVTGVSVGVSNASTVHYKLTDPVGEEDGRFRNRTIGGVFGMVSFYNSYEYFTYTGGSVSVTVGKGYAMGGLFGELHTGSGVYNAVVKNVALNTVFQSTCEEELYVGGLAGKASIASSSFHDNKVSVTTNWKQTASCSVSPSKFYVGGLIGYTDNIGMQLDLFNDSVKTNVAIGKAHNGGGHLIGGLLGYAPHTSIRVVDNVVGTDITDSSTITDSTQIGGLVGATLGTKKGTDYVLDFYRNQVTGNIKVATTSQTYVGGLVGKILHGNTDLEIFHNVSQGNIEVPTAEGVFAGYGAGFIRAEYLSAAGNFHVGTNDKNVPDFVAAYVNGSEEEKNWGVSMDSESFTDICFNYRNAVEGLSATTDEWHWATGEFYSDGKYTFNGILPESKMKTCAFAHVLNQGVSRKRGGASNEALVLNKSWACEEGALPQYVLEYGTEPYAPNMLTVDYSRLNVQMTNDELDKMAPYMAPGADGQFVAFTNKSKVLDSDFITAFNSLDWDYFSSEQVDKVTFWYDDRSVYLYEDKEFFVSYEYTYNGSDYYVFNEENEKVYFYTKNVVKTKLSDVSLVPPIYTVGSVSRDYRLDSYRINCKEDATCGDGPITFSPNDDVVSSFTRDISWLAYNDFSEYTDTLHLVYKKESDEPRVKALPYIAFANSGVIPVNVDVLAYGYDFAGKIALVGGSSASPNASSLSFVKMATQMGFAGSHGYTITGWNVDLWVGFEENYTEEDFDGCYNKSAAKDFCGTNVNAATIDRSLESVLALADSIHKKSFSDAWKWSIELKADETINTENLISFFSKIVNKGFSNPVVYMHITPKGTVIDYNITFLPNEGQLPAIEGSVYGNDIFFDDSWAEQDGGSGTYSLETPDLPSLYSTKYGFAGWNYRENGSYNARQLTTNYLDSLYSVSEKDAESFVAYAVWTEKPTTSTRSLILVAKAPEKKVEGVEAPVVSLNGKIDLYQTYTVDGETRKVNHEFEESEEIYDGSYARESRLLNVPRIEKTMTFHVESRPDVGYRLVALKDSAVAATESGKPVVSDVTFGTEDAVFQVKRDAMEHYLVAQFDPIPYFFTFSRETGSDWFYPTDWRDTAIYSVEISDDQPNVPMMYSINGESVGWHIAKTIADGCDCSPVDSKYVISEYMYREDYYTEKDSLYMILDKENVSNETMKINEAALGDVRLVQSIGSKDDGFVVDTISHSFVDGEMLIPSVDADFEFTVRLAVDKGYAIESAEYTFDTTIVNNRVSRTYPLENGAKIVLNPRKMRNIQFNVVTTPVRYMIAFDNPDTAGVIYEKEFFEHGDYTIEREDLSYPSGMYTSDRCLLGWKSEGSNEVMTSFDVEKMDGLKDGENTLTAVWGDAAACDNEVSEKDTLEGPYNRLVLDAKGGSVEIVQMVKNAAGQDSVVRTRKFGDDNSMLFPQDISENTWYVVNVVANDGYEVPEVLYFYNDTGRGAEKGDTVEIKNGDALYNDRLFASVLKAVFNKIDDTPDDTTEIVFVDPTLLVSGNAMQVRFATNEFNVDRKAKIRLDLLDVMGNEIDSMIVDVDEAPYSSSWTKTSLAPGSYVLTGTIWDAYKESTFDTSFVVANKIVAATMDGWQMLALDVIDKKSVDWTDSDAVFFWWDEHSSVGEYWQYRTYGEEDKVSLVTGGWYSSLEGRALEIREDVEVPESAEWVLENEFSGWNLVANPYNWTIANPVDSGWCWLPDIADYDVAPKFLEPYQAIWVRTDKNTTISLDKTPVFETNVQKDNAEGAGEKRRALAKANSKFDWAIRAILQDEKGRTDGWNVLGVGDMAQVEEPPESMADHVNLSIVEGRKHLAKSMKQVSEDGYTWNLEVSATSNRRGFLGFEGMDRLAALGYRLFVTVDERTVEMTDGQELPVALKSLSKSVKVQVVKSEAQLATSVSGLKMVQQGSMVNVSFNVPAELSGSRFVAEVAGLDGKKMNSSSGKAISGRNEVHMNIPKSGLYFVRVRVASQQASGKFLAK